MPATAILVPVLRRPHRVRPLLQSIAATTRRPYRVYFIPDPDDEGEIAAIEEVGGSIVCSLKGNYAEKINAAAKLTDEPLIFMAADDLFFHEHWLERAGERLVDGVLVVGTNDLCNPRTAGAPLEQMKARAPGTLTHSTHTLVHRDYVELGTIDEPGKLLHEGYLHEFVDDEFVETAKFRGVYAHAADSIVEHLHPMAGKAPMDDLYSMMDARMHYGRRTYRRRRHLWTEAM